MRIVFLQKTTDAQGGSKASLRSTLEALSSLRGLDIEVLGECEGALCDFCQSLSIPFRVAPFPRWRNALDRLKFKSTIRSYARSLGQADWVISNEMWWAPHAVVLAEHCQAKAATIVRDEIADIKKARQYRFKALDCVITVAEDLRLQYKEEAALYERTRTIYNIVERPAVIPEAVAALEAQCARYSSVGRWVLSAGTICPRKDQMLLVKTLAEMERRGDALTGLLIVGGDDGSNYVSELRDLIQHHSLEDRVCFTGQIEGIGAALECASAKVLTSHSEGLPRVLIECALAGLPSLSTKVSGVDEVYGDYASACVCQSRDPCELAEKLSELLNQPNEYMMCELKTRIEAKFSIQTHIAAWKKMLELPIG